MLENLYSYLKFGNTFCGIEHVSKNGKETIFAFKLKKEKKELHITANYSCNNISNIPLKEFKSKATSLVLNNENVLFKTVNSIKGDHNQLINLAFPNINIQDFYYNILSVGDNSYIWICRKKIVEELIEKYNDINIYITEVFIGNSSIINALEFIKDEIIATTNALVTIKNGKLNSIEKQTEVNSKRYNINGLGVESNYLLSFSGILQNLLKSEKVITNIDVSSLEDEYTHQRFYNLFSKAALFLVFFALLVNFLVFNFYFNQVNTLQVVTKNYQDSKASLIKLNDEVEKKSMLVKDLFRIKSSKSSFYSHEIVSVLPESLLLSKLNYQPIKGQFKSNKKIDVSNNEIIASGTATNHDDFSKWTAILESKPWVAGVLIINYGAQSNNYSDFEIKVKIKE